MSTFMSELRQPSQYCDFGNGLSDMQRDRLVCDINDDQIQRRLLSEPKHTFQKAFDLAQAMELADKGTHDLQNIRQSPQSVTDLFVASVMIKYKEDCCLSSNACSRNHST